MTKRVSDHVRVEMTPSAASASKKLKKIESSIMGSEAKHQAKASLREQRKQQGARAKAMKAAKGSYGK